MGTGSTLFSDGLFEDSLNLEGIDSTLFSDRLFGGSSNLEGTGSTLFFDRLFWWQLKFGGNLLPIIFWWIILEIWRELTSHYFPADCFGGSSDLAGTGSTLFSGRLFSRQLKFGGNWLHIVLADCFGGSSNLVGNGSTLFSDRLF